MIWPDRFPFDVLDPAPAFCLGCSCELSEGVVQPDCRRIDCGCHAGWLNETDELGHDGLREYWGDK